MDTLHCCYLDHKLGAKVHSSAEGIDRVDCYKEVDDLSQAVNKSEAQDYALVEILDNYKVATKQASEEVNLVANLFFEQLEVEVPLASINQVANTTNMMMEVNWLRMKHHVGC
jgi:hypothetical protein